MSNTDNTVTGRVTATEHASTSMYGNPAYFVTLDDGETYRTMDNVMLAYAITNAEYRDQPHVFTLTRAGRIRNARPVESAATLDTLDTDTLDEWDAEPLYTVYTLVDGMVEDIYDGDSFDDACRAFDLAARIEHARRVDARYDGIDYGEVSVHLYEPLNGIMHAELTIEQA